MTRAKYQSLRCLRILFMLISSIILVGVGLTTITGGTKLIGLISVGLIVVGLIHWRFWPPICCPLHRDD